MLKRIVIPSPFSPLFFFLLVCWKCLFFLLYQFKIEDLWHHQTLAIHFAKGYGLQYMHATTNNLSEWYTEALFRWPPLISVLLGGLFQLTGNMDFSTGVLVVVAFTLLFVSVRSLVKQLHFSLPAQWLVWVFFFFNPVLTDLFSVTDLLSLSFWIWAFALFLQMAETGKKPHLILFVFLLFLPAMFRYQYYPLVLILPLALWLMALNNRNQKLTNYSLRVAAGVLCLILLQSVLLRWMSGQGVYLADEWGGNVKNLTRISPFFLNAFVPVYLPVNLAAEVFHLNIIFLYQLVGLISLTAFVLFVFALLKQPAAGTRSGFRFVSLLTLLILFLYLCLLSLLYKEQINGSSTFTYVQEPRYWALALLLLPLLLTSYIQERVPRQTSFVLFFALFLNLLPVGYRLYKTIIRKDASSLYSYRMKFKTNTAGYIDQLQAKEVRPVVLACFDSDFAMYNSRRPYATVAYDSLLRKGTVSFSRPVWFWMITRDSLTQKEEQFILQNRLVPVTKESGFYRLYRNR